MSVLNLYAKQSEDEINYKRQVFPDRADSLKQLESKNFCDVLVVGGGLRATFFARLSALQGLRTVLLERSDYGSGSSGRGPSLMHAFAEHYHLPGTLGLMVKSRQARELYEIAPSLMRAVQFDASHLGKFGQVRARLAQVFRKIVPPRGSLSEAFVLNEGLLLNQSVIAARQEGALCLNYAGVDSIGPLQDGSVEVGWREHSSGRSGQLRAGVLINCSGAWLAQMGRLSPSALGSKLRSTRVVNLIFNQNWSGPAQVRPFFARGSRYFVFPYESYTVVSVPSSECKEPKFEPLPKEEELERALLAIERDLAGSGLDRHSLFHVAASIRPFYCPDKALPLNSLSAKGHWLQHDGMLHLLGGELIESLDCAFDGFKKLSELTAFRDKLAPLQGRKLPSVSKGASLSERVNELLDICQIESIKDLMRRGLGLEFTPTYGLEFLNEISAIFKEKRPDINLQKSQMEYRGYIEKIRALIASTA